MRDRIAVSMILVCMLAAVTTPGSQTAAAEEKIPRILLVGDSWPMFLWTGMFFWTYENGSAFRDVLPETPRFARWCDRGLTALGGTMVTQWSTNEMTETPYGPMGKLDFIARELAEHPTLDIVHLNFGGNDYIRGDYSAFVPVKTFQMQTIGFGGEPTGGAFTLTFQGATTNPIPFESDASVVQAELEALATIGAGNIEVQNTSGVPRYFCWFKGAFAEVNVPMMTANGSGLAGNGDESATAYGVNFDHGWKDTWGHESPAELAFAMAVLTEMQKVVEFILDVRPDLRLLFCDYDYMDEGVGGAEALEANQALANAGRIKLEVVNMVTAKPQYAGRCFYHNTFGLMQYTFGYPCDFAETSPAPNEERVAITPLEDMMYKPMGQPGTNGAISLPGMYPGYAPWTGGDINYPSPRIAIIYNFGKSSLAPEWMKGPKGGNIHLHKEANHVYARYCIDTWYGAWLDLPKVLSVERATMHPTHPQSIFDPNGLPTVQFRVKFMQPVTGVDETDFQTIATGTLVNCAVEEVVPETGGDSYLVTVATGIGDGALNLAVRDDDSIKDGSNVALGGAGTGNGYFAYGQPYTINRAVKVPVGGTAALMLLLIAVGIRRNRP